MDDKNLKETTERRMKQVSDAQSLIREAVEAGYRIGVSSQMGDCHHPADAADETCEAFWSRLRELVPVEEDEARNYIGAYDVFEGMRIRMFRDEDDEPDKRFKGATGVIVLPDTDGCPGVHFDDAYSTLNDLGPSVRDAGVPFTYISIENAERIDDDK